jgi:raffinose/stachyose/melibiose transport system substrate-binding protein
MAAVVAATMGLLVACSGSAGDGATPGSGSGSPGGTDQKVTISLSMQNANVKEQDPATYAVVQAFQAKYPNVTVDIQGQPVEQHLQAMQVAAQSDTLPDIFWVYNSIAQTMQKDGKLLDLAPILESTGIKDKFAQSMLSGFEQDGAQYGLPYQALITGFYYNKAILSKYGLDVPVTSDDLLNVVKTLKANGVVPIAQGAKDSSFSVWAYLTMLDRFGYEQQYPSILAGSASYNNPDFQQVYEYLKALAEAGAFPANMATQTYVQAVESFKSGRAAMLNSGVWQAGEIQKSEVGGDTGFWAGPTFANGVGKQELAMNVASAPFVVAAKVNQDAAKLQAVTDFLGFYYSDAGQQLLIDNAQAPVTTYQGTIASDQSVFAAVLAEASKPGWSSPQAQPDLVVPAATAAAMYDSMYGVMQGVYSPSEALDVVQASIK